MKKILFVTRNLNGGGAERVIINLSNEFIDKGMKVTIIKLDSEPPFYKLNENINVISIDNIEGNKLFKKIKLYKKIVDKIKFIKPDIIVSMPEEIGIYLLMFSKGLKIPIVVSERNDPRIMPYKRITRYLRTIAYKKGSGFIFQTEEAKDYFNKKIIDKSIVLPNPINISDLPNVTKINEREKEIIGIGRLTPQKNFSLLIKAFKLVNNKYRDYRLGIYGSGPLEVELKQLAIKENLETKVTFYGKVDGLLEKIKSKFIYVLSSDFEGVPNALIECLALGIPSIATNLENGGTKVLIKNYDNGIIVPKGDYHFLSSEIINLIENKKLYKKIYENSIKIRGELDSKRVSLKWLEFLNKIYNEYHN